MIIETPPVGEHLRHMTDGRWHDNCQFCLNRRVKGGTGVPAADLAAYDASLPGPKWVPKLSAQCSYLGECGSCDWPLCSCACHEPETADVTETAS